MKSMLHEASSVIKAIEKAWIDSGKPLEFTINIHEVGEKNFLGFTKRPAIVSIAYDPRKQPNKNFDKKEAPSAYSKPSRPQAAKPTRPEQKPESAQQGRDAAAKAQNQPKQRFTTAKAELPQAATPQAPEDFWTADLITDIKLWFKEAIGLLGENIPCEFSADKRMLRVTFEKSLLSSSEDERQLFIGLSYLLLQCLKKKHKKKLRGYHLIISSKNHAAPDITPSH